MDEDKWRNAAGTAYACALILAFIVGWLAWPGCATLDRHAPAEYTEVCGTCHIVPDPGKERVRAWTGHRCPKGLHKMFAAYERKTGKVLSVQEREVIETFLHRGNKNAMDSE